MTITNPTNQRIRGAERAARIRDAHAKNPDLSQSQLAARFGCDKSTVREALTPKPETKRRKS